MNPQPDPQQPQPAASPIQPTPPTPSPQATVMPSPLSDNKPVIFIIVIIILIFLGAFYYFILSREGNQSQLVPVNQTPTVVPAKATATPIMSPPASATDSSDTQLDKDIQTINNKIGSLNTDVNNVDQGINDKAIDTGL